nr:prolyl-tRNA synthetase associated domain-containing protein [Maliibacterium massiliense]
MQYDQQGVRALLEAHGIAYTHQMHAAVHTMAEAEALPALGAAPKNLFLQDQKGRRFFLLTACAQKRLDIKALRAQLGAAPLRFAASDTLARVLGVAQGAVSPLNLLGDAAHLVELLFDAALCREARIGVHPNDNTATLWLAPGDLLALLRVRGCTVHVLGLPEIQQ